MECHKAKRSAGPKENSRCRRGLITISRNKSLEQMGISSLQTNESSMTTDNTAVCTTNLPDNDCHRHSPSLSLSPSLPLSPSLSLSLSLFFALFFSFFHSFSHALCILSLSLSLTMCVCVCVCMSVCVHPLGFLKADLLLYNVTSSL